MTSPAAFFTAMPGSGSSGRRSSRRIYDSTGVFDGCSVGGQQCPVRIIDLVISIGDDEEVTRHGEPITTD